MLSVKIWLRILSRYNRYDIRREKFDQEGTQVKAFVRDTLTSSFFRTVLDMALVPVVYPAAYLLKNVRRFGVQHLPLSKRALSHVGMFPIRRQYYEPLFDSRDLHHPLSEARVLPGIDLNTEGQLDLLRRFCFNEEIGDLAGAKTDELTFRIENGSFEGGDAEYFYNLIRLVKPKRIVEIGSGNSTLIAMRAVAKNREESSDYGCKHVCIEPYEMPWLEKTGATIIRKKVEDVDAGMFAELEQNDILFIDSSHMIRPQGDVLREYLEIIPSLKVGVIVHIHDIFLPRDYPKQWIEAEVRFWNEQYLLEAFLSGNSNWKILGALNYLRHSQYESLKISCPYLTQQSEPGSFYMTRVA